MIIAVDGPAASGKGTLARRLARHFGYAYLDTGLLYRAVGLALLDSGADPADEQAAVAIARRIDPAQLSAPGLRSEAAGQVASKVAAMGEVRALLLAFQRDFAAHPPGGLAGAVLDGRDIGSVVCPQADRKIYVTASLERRAERRFKELREQGGAIIQDAVLRDMQERDARDMSRAVAPLKPADDAFVLDTSELDADQAFAAALGFIESRRRGG
jgi:cytidylate kinase